MKIAIGSDHRGYSTKERLKEYLIGAGHRVADFGCEKDQSCDYPDYAIPACLEVATRKADRAILLCGSGIGMTMTANKIKGIRAALCHDEVTTQMSRHHNNANVLCLSADLLGEHLIQRMVEVFLEAPFDAGRHARRVKKAMSAENVDIIKAAAKVPVKYVGKAKA
ncbi:MAG: ribose 5-phosphate isomerase B [Planctomycetia bacterium]|nr:ribose 5-phosphate isomerase B [Planctomycetia bacterium]